MSAPVVVVDAGVAGAGPVLTMREQRLIGDVALIGNEPLPPCKRAVCIPLAHVS